MNINFRFCSTNILVTKFDLQPDRPDELERIEHSDGRVIDWNGVRVLGVLATSRSIGTKKKYFILIYFFFWILN